MIECDVDLKEKNYDTSSYGRVCDPDPILLSIICFYVKSFLEQTTVLANGLINEWMLILESMTRVEQMKRMLRVQEEDQDLSELMSLNNYLNEHIEVNASLHHHF